MSLRENELPGSDLERFRTSKIVIGLELPRDPETAIRQPSEPLRNGYRYAGGVLESRELISEPEVDGGFPPLTIFQWRVELDFSVFDGFANLSMGKNHRVFSNIRRGKWAIPVVVKNEPGRETTTLSPSAPHTVPST